MCYLQDFNLSFIPAEYPLILKATHAYEETFFLIHKDPSPYIRYTTRLRRSLDLHLEIDEYNAFKNT